MEIWPKHCDGCLSKMRHILFLPFNWCLIAAKVAGFGQSWEKGKVTLWSFLLLGVGIWSCQCKTLVFDIIRWRWSSKWFVLKPQKCRIIFLSSSSSSSRERIVLNTFISCNQIIFSESKQPFVKKEKKNPTFVFIGLSIGGRKALGGINTNFVF